MALQTLAGPNALDEISADVAERLHAKLGHGGLRRIEPARGDDLFFEWVDGTASRWFEWRVGELTELRARDDRKLPLAELLRDDARARHLRILSWRPRRRMTLLDNTGKKPSVLKGFRIKRFKTTLLRYETAQEALRGTGLQTPEIVDIDDSRAGFRMVYHDGHRLGLSLESTELFRTAGRALAAFQEFEPPNDLGRFTADDELAVVDKRRAQLDRLNAPPPGAWHELRERLDGLRTRLPEPDSGLAHRDLHDKQIVLHGRQLVLLDFDLACRADRALDPANFLAHLVLRKLQGILGATQRSIDACSECFMDGLAGDRAEGFWPRLRFYQATSFCRLALVYRLRPPWAHLGPDLTAMGHRCLDDLRRMGEQL